MLEAFMPFAVYFIISLIFILGICRCVLLLVTEPMHRAIGYVQNQHPINAT